MAVLSFLVPLLAIGVVVMFIVAMIQQGKAEHGGFRQAFYTIVTLVMLALWVGGVVATVIPTLKQFVFTQANSYAMRYDIPPSLYLPGSPSGELKEGNTYNCTDKCEFTTDDKAQFTSWKSQYADWQKRHADTSQQYRNDIVMPLSLLIVGLPLYFAFRRLMERGAKEDNAANKKPAPLRSLYYYFVAFSGLIMAVVALAAVINTTLRVALKADDQTTLYSEPIPGNINQTNSVRSIIACQSKCGFTEADVALANSWLDDFQEYQSKAESSSARIHDDLSNFLPMLAIGFPLFWYHFFRIRKETPSQPPETKPAAVA